MKLGQQIDIDVSNVFRTYLAYLGRFGFKFGPFWFTNPLQLKSSNYDESGFLLLKVCREMIKNRKHSGPILDHFGCNSQQALI